MLPTEAIPVRVIDTYVIYLTAPESDKLTTSTGVDIHCRGAGWPSVQKFVWALSAWEASLNLISNTKSPKLAQKLGRLRRLHVPVGAVSFDIMELARVRKALFSESVPRDDEEEQTECEGGDCNPETGGCPKCTRRNPFASGLKRVQMWPMLLIQLALIARVSEVTEYCPTIDDMRLPDKADKAQWCKDGFPMHIELLLRKWKWSKNRVAVRTVLQVCNTYCEAYSSLPPRPL